MNNILDLDFTKCVGCFACKETCPTKCIKINFDSLGHPFPFIENKNECIDCGRCIKVCQINDKPNLKSCINCYSYVSKQKDAIINSSSGGAFFDIASNFLNKKGVVYGCAFVDQYVSHIRIDDIKNLFLLQGSKYVQSDISNVFRSVLKDLISGNKVLFAGTPCQIYAINKFLQRDFENLYTIDLICHGIPSYKMYQAYLKFIEKSNKKKIKCHYFRLKNSFKIYNRCRFNETLVFSDNTKIIRPYFKSSFYTLFLQKVNYRSSCYSCSFAQLSRVGDITLGDFWGINRKNTITNSDYGCSLILANSEKGLFLIKELNGSLLIEDLHKAADNNEQLNKPSKEHELRKLLLKYNFEDYSLIEKFYRKFFQKERLKGTIKYITPRFIKRLIKHEK